MGHVNLSYYNTPTKKKVEERGRKEVKLQEEKKKKKVVERSISEEKENKDKSPPRNLIPTTQPQQPKTFQDYMHSSPYKSTYAKESYARKQMAERSPFRKNEAENGTVVRCMEVRFFDCDILQFESNHMKWIIFDNQLLYHS